MPLSAQQIVTLSLQAAGGPGYTSQAGQLLNVILSELCQNYDLDVAKGFYQFNFNPILIQFVDNNVLPGGGPYNLPADYLRAKYGDVFWTLLGVPYQMRQVELWEFDQTVQQAGLQNYPRSYATDMSQTPPVMYVYPPPSGAYPVTIRYQRQMPDIVTPETSAIVPWFPNTQWLRTRLTAEIMAITDDERGPALLKQSEEILTRYLKLKDDSENMTQTVKLDPRRFSRAGRLANTKLIGW